jgi:hypothetical protein
MALGFSERLQLRQERSRVQLQREHNARRLWVKTLHGERLRLGGGSRPEAEQVRSGYPTNRVDQYER